MNYLFHRLVKYEYWGMSEMKSNQNVYYIDTHCHLDHLLFGDSRYEVVKKARDAGVKYMINAPVTYESNFTSNEMFPAKDYSDVFFAKGLHPKYAANEPTWNSCMKTQFEQLLADKRTVAIKTGLDYCNTRMQESQKLTQKKFLMMFIDYATEYNLPMILHVREALDDMIASLKEHPINTETVIHCYNSCNWVKTQEVMELGIHYFGIGGMITRGDAALLDSVKNMPMEAILLETDSPFVKLSNGDEKVNTPLVLPQIAMKIAELKGKSFEEVVTQTYENACNFYHLE